MNSEDLKNRTKQFALEVVKLLRTIPDSMETSVFKKQLIRSATSMAANYRACCRSRSRAEFYAKLSIVVEEADESLFWLELIQDAGLKRQEEMRPLVKAATELLRIFAASRKTARENLSRKTNP